MEISWRPAGHRPGATRPQRGPPVAPFRPLVARPGSPQTNPLAGWLAAGALLIVLAFVVGGPAAEQGLLGSRSSLSSGAAIPIRFGLALDPDTNRHPAGRRRQASPRLLRNPPEPPATSTIFVEVERLSGETPRIVQERSVERIAAGRRTSLTLRTDDLLAAWGAGGSRCGSSWDERAAIATGRFRLVAP